MLCGGEVSMPNPRSIRGNASSFGAHASGAMGARSASSDRVAPVKANGR
jgi:hypothetical protein